MDMREFYGDKFNILSGILISDQDRKSKNKLMSKTKNLKTLKRRLLNPYEN